MIAYLITNTVNGKQYVGISRHSTPDLRWKRHIWDASRTLSSKILFHCAIRKYETASFTIRTIGYAIDWKELCILETELIELYGTLKPNGYNLTLGGEGALGLRHTNATKEKMAAAKTGKKQSPEHVARRRSAMTGRKLSPEHIAKLLGRPCSVTTREKIGIANSGRTPSEATRKKMKDRKVTAESRAKMSAAKKGRPLSAIARLNMSIAAKAAGIRPPSSLGRVVSQETREKLRALAIARGDNPPSRKMVTP